MNYYSYRVGNSSLRYLLHFNYNLNIINIAIFSNQHLVDIINTGTAAPTYGLVKILAKVMNKMMIFNQGNAVPLRA